MKRSAAAVLSVLLALGQACAVWAEDADAPFPITSSSTTTIQEDGTVITSDGRGSTDGTGSTVVTGSLSGTPIPAATITLDDADAEAPEDDGSYAGMLGDHGLSTAEFVADYYLDNMDGGQIRPLKDISSWDSEKILSAVEDTSVPKAAKVWKIAHSLTKPASTNQDKLRAYYEAMIVSLLDDSCKLIDWSEIDQMSDDNDMLQSVLDTLGEETKISTLSEEERESLKQDMNEWVPEIPLELDDKAITMVETVKDFADRITRYKAVSNIGGEARTFLSEMKNHTDDQNLKDAVDAVILAMDSSSDGFWEALIVSGADLSEKEYRKAIDYAYKEVMMAIPGVSSFFAGAEIGTAVGDLFTASFFDTEENIAAYLKLECFSEMAGAMNDASDFFGQKYQSEKGGSDVAQRRMDAGTFCWSIHALAQMHVLSYDYIKKWADASTDNTWFQKWVSLLTGDKFGKYDEFYENLANLKSKAVTQKYMLIVDAAGYLQLWYPDDYRLRKVYGISMDEYVSALFKESADKAEEARSDILKDRNTVDSTKHQTEKAAQASAEDLFDEFCDNEIPGTSGDWTFYLRDLQDTSQHPVPYEVGPRIDVDNDGEKELLLVGAEYGGMFLDAESGEVKAFAQGNGDAEYLSYGYYDGVWLVCHQDTSHQGRKLYSFDEYDGADTIVQSFELSAEYGDGPDPNHYNENSTFMFKDQPITMEQYEQLLEQIFAKSDPSYGTAGLARAEDSAGEGQPEGGAEANPETGVDAGSDTQAETAAAPDMVQEADYNGHHYALYRNTMQSFDDAEAFCESMGGHLAVISDEGENEFVHSAFSPASHTTYIGLSEYGGWVDGSPLNYEPLCDFAEMNAPDVNVFYTIGEDGNKWDYWGWYADADHYFICEFDSSDGSANAEPAREEGGANQDYLQALQTADAYNGYASNVFASVDFSGTDEADTEDGYEFRNQTLSIPEFFDSEEAARAALAQTAGGMDVSGPDADGKWTVLLIPDGVRLQQIYAGSIYVRKDAVVTYQNLVNGSPVTLQTSAETFRSQWPQIAGTSLCFIKSFDENGYATQLEAMQFNMLIPEGDGSAP